MLQEHAASSHLDNKIRDIFFKTDKEATSKILG